MKFMNLSLDLETKSSVDITKCGAYKYAESPDFEILLFGVSVNHGPITVYDLACGDTVPEEILSALSDDSVTKWAYNASFERICLSVWLRRNYPQYFSTYSIEGDPVQGYLDPSAWKCSLVLAAYNGLPLGLEKVGAVLGFEEQKLKEGKELIRYFCTPCKPTKSNGGRTWNLPEHAPDKWALFKKYNERDVQVEMQIQERLKNYPVPDAVWEEYHLDQEINDRGIMIDQQMVAQAIRIDDLSKTDLTAKMQEKGPGPRPESVLDPPASRCALIIRMAELAHFRHVVGDPAERGGGIPPGQNDLQSLRPAGDKVQHILFRHHVTVYGRDDFIQDKQPIAAGLPVRQAGVPAKHLGFVQKTSIGFFGPGKLFLVHGPDKAERLRHNAHVNARDTAQNSDFRGRAVLEELCEQHPFSGARHAQRQPRGSGRLALAVAAVDMDQTLHKLPH